MSAATATLLGQVIATHTQRISDSLDRLKEDGSMPDLPVELQRVRRELLDAILELQQLVLGPKEALFLWAVSRSPLNPVRACPWLQEMVTHYPPNPLAK